LKIKNAWPVICQSPQGGAQYCQILPRSSCKHAKPLLEADGQDLLPSLANNNPTRRLPRERTPEYLRFKEWDTSPYVLLISRIGSVHGSLSWKYLELLRLARSLFPLRCMIRRQIIKSTVRPIRLFQARFITASKARKLLSPTAIPSLANLPVWRTFSKKSTSMSADLKQAAATLASVEQSGAPAAATAPNGTSHANGEVDGVDGVGEMSKKGGRCLSPMQPSQI